METLFAESPDHIQIAYDHLGSGPAVVLLHGGGGRRQDWHEAGYVQRLKEEFTVITIDLRGHGESDQPTDPFDYSISKMCQDILAVVDACKFKRFFLWGMSFGGKVSRYIAVQSGRVEKLVLMSTQLGPGVSGRLRQQAIEFRDHWPAILESLDNGSVEFASLPPEDQDVLQRLNVPVLLAWVQAMLAWPRTDPQDFPCPTLWLVGSEDQDAMASVNEYKKSLQDSLIDLHIIDGLEHDQVFEAIDTVLPLMREFTAS